MLLGCSLIDGCSWTLGAAASEILCLPDEVLEQISLVLCEEQNLGLFNNVTKVANEMSSFWRQFRRWRGKAFRRER